MSTPSFKDHFRVFATITVAAVVLASAYGMLHNQLSYTISREFFTCFKFVQFGLVDSPLPERVRASIVGFGASWWVGLIAGVLIALASGIEPDPRARRRSGMIALATMLGCTIVVALGGIAMGMWRPPDAAAIASMRHGGAIPTCVTDPVAFVRAGWMHNASYLGGAIGLALAVLVIVIGWVLRATRA
ncbi:MAG: hypothetical protein U0625_00365 [Phycisphaerales bacterium]